MTKQKNVTIIAKNDGSAIDFEMKEGGTPTDLLQFTGGSADITFTLQNQGGANLEFVQNVNDVMYVIRGSNNHLPRCPKNNAGNPATPFSVTSVSANTLEVSNANPNVCFYKFALNFVDKNNNNKIIPYDPIYDNRNGGNQFALSATTAAIGGAAAGVLLTMLAFNVGLFG